MKPYKISLALLLTQFISSCIGTDVIEEVIVPEELSISSEISSIKVGESVTFTADYFNNVGELEEVDINWSSSDEAIISIDNDGIATANTEGTVFIYAAAQNLKDSLEVEAGSETTSLNARMASFQGSSSYNVSGDAVLDEIDGFLKLKFEDNFSASSGPGLHVYLSNYSSGVNGGVDLGELKANSGEQEYNIPTNVNLNTYDFIIIYCQPFEVTFGYGELD